MPRVCQFTGARTGRGNRVRAPVNWQTRAMVRDTGARALRAVIDEFMLESMYELPEVQSSGVTYVVDAQAIENNLSLADLPQRKAKESA